MKRSFRLPPGTVSAAALMLGASPAVMVGLGAALGLIGPASEANGQPIEQRLKSFGFPGQAAAYPVSLVQGSDGALYGTTFSSPWNYYGYFSAVGGGGVVFSGPSVVFRLKTNGSGFTVLHTFGDFDYPQTVVQARDGALFGTTGSGRSGNGTVFKLNADGTGYAVLHRFTGSGGDGANPGAGMMQGSDGALYGTTSGGGSSDRGTVFKLNADGTGYTVLRHFTGTGGDGAYPYAGLVQGSDGFLYGTTSAGGTNNSGTVFRLSTDGTDYSVLYCFGSERGDSFDPGTLLQGSDGMLYGTTCSGGTYTKGIVFKLSTKGTGYAVLYSFTGSGEDGANPGAKLVQGSDGALYGTTEDGGGTNAYGTVFKLNTDGTGYAVLYRFPGSAGDGIYPQAGLVQGRDGLLYGTTEYGGSWNYGTVFKLNRNGTDYAVLHCLAGFSGGDGYYPSTGLLHGSDGMLYGTTYAGGANDLGTVFKMGADGTGYTLLYSFTSTSGDGANPRASLMQGSDGMLYGTTWGGGGTNDYGTVFRLSIDGTGYNVLYSFTGSSGDGANPRASLVQGSDGMLYGTTSSGGGTNNGGTVFRLSTDGTGYTVLRGFTGGSDGAGPDGLLQGSDGMFYGTTFTGGINNNGTVFRLSGDGTGYTVLRRFTGTGGDGASPAGLIQGRDGALYGTALGGENGNATVFKLSTDGTSYTVLHRFTGTGGDGAVPNAPLVQGNDGALYGTTSQGGTSGNGTVFKLNTNGTGYTVLYSFTGSSGDGAFPYASLVQSSDGVLYGTTEFGGDLGLGAVFRLGPVPPPRFTQFARPQAGSIQLTLAGAPYVTWRVEVATNLNSAVAWTLLTNVTPTNGTAEFSDLGATNSLRRFYRALWP